MTVVDTNVISYLFINGDYTKYAEKLLSIDPDWISPLLWRSEFRSVFSLYIRKNKITLDEANKLTQLAEEFMENKEFHVDSTLVYELVSSSNCSSYDCEFVALAKSLNLNLFTSDKKVIIEFPNIVKSLLKV